jgi:RNA-directed DNA polymerase
MSRRRPTSDRLASSGDAHGRVPPGYGERHVRTVRSGTGEARLGSLVSKDRTYKPVVKSSGAKRESDGVVVLPIAGMNPAGGKDPDFGHAGARGTRKGMAGTAQSNYPGGRSPDVNVRRLQNRLWATAKQHSERRFHALYDRIYRRDVLWEAWERVRANRGAAGVDGVTLAAVEEYGPARLIDGLARDLRAGNYHPAPVRRVEIPKPDGRTRPLGIPTVKDRIAQQATKLVLEPIFEADFLSCSFGFRPKRSALDAMEKLRVGFIEGSHFVFEADIENFFGTIDHDKLLSLVGERVSDRRVLKLLRGWLAAGVLADGVVTETVSGTPQGGVISPLLANVYLHAFDRAWAEQGVGEVVRYADDFVVLCHSQAEAEKAREVAAALLCDLGLTLHPDKTRTVDLREGREGFDFLGCHFRARMSGKLWEQKRIIRYYLHRWPSLRSMTCSGEDQGPHGQKSGRAGVGGGYWPPQPVPSGLGQLLPHRERCGQVRRNGPLRRVAAAALAHQEARPQPPSGTGGNLVPHLVPRPGPAPTHGHNPIPESCVTMSRTTVGELYAGKPHVQIERGMGNRAVMAPRP